MLFYSCVFQSFQHCEYLAWRANISAFRTFVRFADLVLSVSSSSWCLERAAAHYENTPIQIY